MEQQFVKTWLYHEIFGRNGEPNLWTQIKGVCFYPSLHRVLPGYSQAGSANLTKWLASNHFVHALANKISRFYVEVMQHLVSLRRL
jgi:hypothetical protein